MPARLLSAGEGTHFFHLLCAATPEDIYLNVGGERFFSYEKRASNCSVFAEELHPNQNRLCKANVPSFTYLFCQRRGKCGRLRVRTGCLSALALTPTVSGWKGLE